MTNLETELKTLLSNAKVYESEKELIETIADSIQHINSQLTDYYIEDWEEVKDKARNEFDNCTVVEDWEDLKLYLEQETALDTDKPESWDELDKESYEDFCNNTFIIYLEKECYYIIVSNIKGYINLD